MEGAKGGGGRAFLALMSVSSTPPTSGTLDETPGYRGPSTPFPAKNPEERKNEHVYILGVGVIAPPTPLTPSKFLFAQFILRGLVLIFMLRSN